MSSSSNIRAVLRVHCFRDQADHFVILGGKRLIAGRSRRKRRRVRFNLRRRPGSGLTVYHLIERDAPLIVNAALKIMRLAEVIAVALALVDLRPAGEVGRGGVAALASPPVIWPFLTGQYTVFI